MAALSADRPLPVALISVAILLSACAQRTPSASATGATPIPTPAASTPPSTEPSPTPLPANSVVLPPVSGPVDGGTVAGLLANANGFYAFGNGPDREGYVPYLLHGSADGRSWQPLDSSALGTLWNGAGNDAATVLLAADVPGQPAGPVIWRTTDDQTWTRLDGWTTDPVNFLESVTAGPGGFALIGTVQEGDGTAAVWTSRDGLTWTRHAFAPATLSLGAVVLQDEVLLFTSNDTGPDLHVWSVPFDAGDAISQAAPPQMGDAGDYGILAILPVGDRLVALTCDAGAMRSCPVTSAVRAWGAAAPASVDAELTWQPMGDFTTLLANQALSATVADGSRALILGWDRTTRAGTAWVSEDGSTWQTAPLGDALRGGVPDRVALGADAMVAAGWGPSSLRETWAQLDSSSDGLSWRATAALAEAQIVEVDSCPSAPTTVDELMQIGPVVSAACFGSDPLTLTGFSSDCGGCGGVPVDQPDPDWINGFLPPWFISATTNADGMDRGMGVWLSPSADLGQLPARGTPITVIGHYNDPVSPSCRTLPIFHGYAMDPPAKSEAECRTSFVVTGVRAG